MSKRIPWVAIVDYGMGNLFSVRQACTQVGLHAQITSDKSDVLSADAVIIPGVGAFGDAMATLRRLDLVRPINDLAAAGTPIFGICLGMQLFMTESHEFGNHKGLGLIEGDVVRLQPLNPQDAKLLKVPQVGWNQIKKPKDSLSDWDNTLLSGVQDGEYFYYVHSYYVRPAAHSVILAETEYGINTFSSVLAKDNLFACQGHPERSGQRGLQIYRNLATKVLVQEEKRGN